MGAHRLEVTLALPGTLGVQLGVSDRVAWLLDQAELTAGQGPGRWHPSLGSWCGRGTSPQPGRPDGRC